MNGFAENVAGSMSPLLGQATPSGPPWWANVVPLLLLMVVFYFALFYPQQKKAKEHARMLKAIKPGDKVITSGGIVGVVVALRDKSLSIRSADTKIEVLQSAVTEITEKASGGGES